MPLRIAFDLDGVLADLGSELTRCADALFGEGNRRVDPSGLSDNDALPVPLALSPGQRRRLWTHVQAIENFWETLSELEPGVVERLGTIAAAQRWEVIFLTRRPSSAGATAQVQSHRWLQSKGFPCPSVYVVRGSRGRVAAALRLDVVVDDRPENCLDVVADSKARAILVWRDAGRQMPPSARRLGIGVVETMAECLDILSQVEVPPIGRAGLLQRIRRAFGLIHAQPRQ
jgi:hypothetical protein